MGFNGQFHKYNHMHGINVRCAIFCTNHQHSTKDHKTNLEMNVPKYMGINNYTAAREVVSMMTKDFSDKINNMITINISTL